MPNVLYKLTLTSEQINSGPYYNVTYTTGAYYSPVLAGSPAFLPNVGSTAVVQIPEAASSASYLAFNLNNNGDGGICAYCDNDVIFVITGSAPFTQCCTGSILTTAESASLLKITYNSSTTNGSCLSCSYATFQTSSDGFDWGGDKTGSCGISQSVTFTLPSASCPANITYYRAYQTCTAPIGITSSAYWTTSSFSSTTSSFCCTPTITSVEPSGSLTSSLFVNFTTGSTGCCLDCSYMTLVTSSNGVSFGGAVTASCSSGQFITPAPSEGNTFYFRIQQTCTGSVTSSFSGTEAYHNSGGGGGQTIFEFGDCGKGNSVAEACSDYPTSILYSDCDSNTFGVGCMVYTDSGGNNPLLGYSDIFMNGANWKVNTSVGVVTQYSPQQC
jgi:hypothetical protein